MTNATDMAKYLIHLLEDEIGDDTLVPLDDLENGEFAYIDDEDGSIFLITVARAKLVSINEVVEL
jgi:hypothetical protein